MKSIFVSGLLFFMILAFSSCTKSGTHDQDPNNAVIDLDALTGQTWVYYEYIKDFNTYDSKLVWKKNRNQNFFDLSLNQVTYNEDGTYIETNEYGLTHKGTWALRNGTALEVKSSEDSTVYTIAELTSDRFEWSVPGDNYGIMVPKDQVASTTDRLELLTSKTWVYAAFFDDYDYIKPTLSWKKNKKNNRENYSIKQVTFNTDGTYSEITWDGSTLDGTWTFVNGESKFKVVNSLGTWISTIEVLNENRFEWSYGSQYAEMVPLR